MRASRTVLWSEIAPGKQRNSHDLKIITGDRAGLHLGFAAGKGKRTAIDHKIVSDEVAAHGQFANHPRLRARYFLKTLQQLTVELALGRGLLVASLGKFQAQG